MHLNAFLMEAGHHEAAWRLPESNPRAEWDLKHWVDTARLAESAGFDSIFLADILAVGEGGLYRSAGQFEPLSLLTWIAAHTEHIGLIATVSTTFNDPFNLARRLATLDHLSGGRVGWNIVTSCGDDEARNYSHTELLDAETRYRRASEFVSVCKKLWDSWPMEAVLADKESGQFLDPDLIKRADHEGEFFSVAGPLNTPQSPQRYPVLVQAGSSAPGMGLAAEVAEVVFTAHQTIASAQTFYSGVKQLTAARGRDPELVRIMPGLVPIIGGTEEEAKAKAARVDDLIVTKRGLLGLSNNFGEDLSGLDPDGPLPAHLFARDRDTMQSRPALILDLAQREGLTVRQIIRRLGGGRGHYVLAATPEQIADTMQRWVDEGAADGFNLMPAATATGLSEFVEHVTPILRARSLVREGGYAGRTLRDNLGLPYPTNSLSEDAPAFA